MEVPRRNSCLAFASAKIGSSGKEAGVRGRWKVNSVCSFVLFVEIVAVCRTAPRRNKCCCAAVISSAVPRVVLIGEVGRSGVRHLATYCVKFRLKSPIVVKLGKNKDNPLCKETECTRKMHGEVFYNLAKSKAVGKFLACLPAIFQTRFCVNLLSNCPNKQGDSCKEKT